jgi:hypothetical protein
MIHMIEQLVRQLTNDFNLEGPNPRLESHDSKLGVFNPNSGVLTLS